MLRTLLAAAFILTGWTGLANAFELIPIVQDFSPVGADATQTFGIVNKDKEPVAVQIAIVKRDVAFDGTETLTPAEEEFLVYPPQAIVAPGKVQVVQVRWLGDRAPKQELAYRIIAEQLPVQLEQNAPAGGGVVNILLRYEGAVYVVPPGVKPDVRLEGVARVETADGPKLAVTLANRGSSHGIVTNPVLSLRGRGTDGRSLSVDLNAEAVDLLTGANVQAGNRRQFLLEWPAGLAAADLTATLKAEYTR
jgi:fimbrial chaperone protein